MNTATVLRLTFEQFLTELKIEGKLKGFPIKIVVDPQNKKSKPGYDFCEIKSNIYDRAIRSIPIWELMKNCSLGGLYYFRGVGHKLVNVIRQEMKTLGLPWPETFEQPSNHCIASASQKNDGEMLWNLTEKAKTLHQQQITAIQKQEREEELERARIYAKDILPSLYREVWLLAMKKKASEQLESVRFKLGSLTRRENIFMDAIAESVIAFLKERGLTGLIQDDDGIDGERCGVSNNPGQYVRYVYISWEQPPPVS